MAAKTELDPKRSKLPFAHRQWPACYGCRSAAALQDGRLDRV